jgi:hypothetical protein
MKLFSILGIAALMSMGAAGCVAGADPGVDGELGTATEKLLSSSPSSVAFGNVKVQCTVSQTVLVTNGGPGTASIGSITSSNGRIFFQSGSFPSSIADGGSANLTLNFRPAAQTTYTGTVTVHSTTGGVPNPDLVINVSGTGFPPGPC